MIKLKGDRIKIDMKKKMVKILMIKKLEKNKIL